MAPIDSIPIESVCFDGTWGIYMVSPLPSSPEIMKSVRTGRDDPDKAVTVISYWELKIDWLVIAVVYTSGNECLKYYGVKLDCYQIFLRKNGN